MTSRYAAKNKYVASSHPSERKFWELPRLFRTDMTATSAAELTGLSRSTETATTAC